MLYEFLNEQFGPHDTASVGKVASGKAVPAARRAGPRSTRSRADDLAPAWRGPLPHRDPRRAPPA